MEVRCSLRPFSRRELRPYRFTQSRIRYVNTSNKKYSSLHSVVREWKAMTYNTNIWSKQFSWICRLYFLSCSQLQEGCRIRSITQKHCNNTNISKSKMPWIKSNQPWKAPVQYAVCPSKILLTDGASYLLQGLRFFHGLLGFIHHPQLPCLQTLC